MTDTTTSTKPLRILIVEDSAANQEIVKAHLTHLGHTSDTANNGEEALIALEKKKYDAVIMDCQMPIMDGLQATKIIRSRSKPGIDPETYIIALTADNFTGNKEKLLAIGMNDFIPKPFSKRDLARALSPLNHATSSFTYTPEIIDIFNAEIAESLEALKTAQEQGNQESICQLAHKIEGTTANMGAFEMKAVSFQLKHTTRDKLGSPELVSLYIQQLEDNFKAFKEKLSKESMN